MSGTKTTRCQARSRRLLRPHPEEPRAERRLVGWGGHPISGLPEIGMLYAQVGYSRLAMFETRRYATLLTMRPRESQHARQYAIRRTVAVHEGLDVDDDLLA